MTKKNKKIQWDFLPGMFMMIFLPLVAKGQKVQVDLGKYSWFPDGDFQYDFFMYWKSIVFLILTAGMILVLIDRCVIRGFSVKQWKYFMPLLVHAGLVILSAALSVDKTLSLKGMWQQYESMWILLGYIVVVFYCAQVVETMKDVRTMLWSAAVGAVLPGIIGLTQIAGKDFFYTGIGKWILSAGMDTDAKESMQYLYSGSGNTKAYMTLYAPNYAGVYIVLILPVIVVLTVTAASKAGKIFGCILSVILCICLYGSGSKTGLIVSGIMAITAAVFLQMRKNKKRFYTGLGFTFVIVFLIITGCDFASGHTVINSIKESFHRETYDMEAIQPGKNGVTVNYKNNTLELIPETTEMGQTLTGILNQKDNLLAVWDTDSQCFRFRDTVYEDLEFDAYAQDQIDYLIIRQGEITWNFLKEQDSEKYVYLNQYGKEDEIVNAPAILKGYERVFSDRGYIWGRTIPLIAKHLLWGSGPDTFAVEFPQTDYVMKANTSLNMYQQLPTKAHNMYFQSALQTGVLSALCLIVFWMRYMIRFIKNFRKNFRQEKNRFCNLAGLGIFLGITGFLLMGIMNDSNLATAPAFWCLLGTGIAVDLAA